MQTADMLKTLQLLYPLQNLDAITDKAVRASWTHRDYLDRLLEGECERRKCNAIGRRIQEARFPVPKEVSDFNWNWPTKINRAQIQDLFRLAFVPAHANVVFIGGVGLGKTHLASALGRRACQQGYSVLFTTAVGIVNSLAAAQAA